MTEDAHLESVERRQRELMLLAAVALIVALAALALAAYAVHRAGQPHEAAERPAVTKGTR